MSDQYKKLLSLNMLFEADTKGLFPHKIIDGGVMEKAPLTQCVGQG